MPIVFILNNLSNLKLKKMDNKSKENNDLCDLVIKSSNSVLNINNIRSNTNRKKREYKHETISKDS